MTLFPHYFDAFLDIGVAANALKAEGENSFEVNIVSLRDHSEKGYKGVDDSVYGGGAGMVMRADVLKKALMEGVVTPGAYKDIKKELHIVYPAPRGKTWNNSYAKKWAAEFLDFSSEKDIVMICGRYEGIDERFLENYVDEYISLGDFILTGGELAVMTILDSALRFVPGVLGNQLSNIDESFQNNKIEYPVYTKPREFEGKLVPHELVSGHHQKIQNYKKTQSDLMTQKFRPDLL